MFGHQFVNFVFRQQETPNPDEDSRRFQRNLSFLRNGSQDFVFPDYHKFPYYVKDIFEYFEAVLHKKDFIDFLNGNLFKENIINAYFKILEKMN